MTCKSIRGFMFGGRHLHRNYNGEWQGFHGVTIADNQVICIRCGQFWFERKRILESTRGTLG